MEEETFPGIPDRRTELRVGLTVISLMEGDITEAAVDAIVNAANSRLQLGAGVAGAIREKGGPAIQQECDRIGSIKVGEAVITGAGDLRARHVIHAVGPRMGEGNEDEKLRMATWNALRVATEHAYASIAFPAISTGVFGFPMERCAAVMLKAIVDFVEQQKTTLRAIDLCLYGLEAMTSFVRELDKIRSRLEAGHRV